MLSLAAARPEAVSPLRLARAVGYLILLQFFCFLQWNMPGPLLLAVVALVALAFPVFILHGKDGNAYGEAVPILVSLAALSPPGGQLTHGYAVALMLFSSLIWLVWHCVTVRLGQSAMAVVDHTALPQH